MMLTWAANANLLLWQQLDCRNIDFSNPNNLTKCPFGAVPLTAAAALFADDPVEQEPSDAGVLAAVAVQPGNIPPVLDPDKYYYDQTQGMLFFEVEQTQANAVGPSPLGTCKTGNPNNGTDPAACLDTVGLGESFYSCPGLGCVLYSVQTDLAYKPDGPTTCKPYDASLGQNQFGLNGYELPYPSTMNRLVYGAGPNKGKDIVMNLVEGTPLPTDCSTVSNRCVPGNGAQLKVQFSHIVDVNHGSAQGKPANSLCSN